MSKKLILTVAIIVIFAGTGIYFTLRRQSSPPQPKITNFQECVRAGYPVGESYPRQCWTPDGKRFVEDIIKKPSPSPSPITISGELTCLPKKGSGMQTLECVIGLKGEDGNYYALKNLSDHNPNYKFSQTELPVEVRGTLSKEEMSGPDGNKYNIAGAITISSIKENYGEREITLREGQRESSFLLQKVYSDRVEGLNYWEYPIATGKGYPVTLRIGETVSNGCTVQLTLVRIEGSTAIFSKQTNLNRPCPICLSGNTLIDTPSGQVPVKDLQAGMLVWTIDKFGHRVSSVITKTSKVPAPPTHQMVRLILDDGRELFVSPGHPTIDNRTMSELMPGETYNGATILSAVRVPYGGGETYDLLPSGDTGFYWANGILIGSTLRYEK